MRVSVEKPGSPTEILEHVGVKGMKWGVRRAVDKSIGTKTAGRKPINRNRQARAEFKRKNPTRFERDQAIKSARFRQQTGKKLSNEDRAVALRFTTGEKTVLSLLAVTGFATIPIAAISGTTVAIRRHRERK